MVVQRSRPCSGGRPFRRRPIAGVRPRGSRAHGCQCSWVMTPRQLAMLLSLAALWGASFLFMRVSVPAFGPIVLAGGRLAAAELEIEASLAAVLNAMAPLFGALVAAVWVGHRVTLAAKAGLVFGVAGVALVVGLSPFTLDLSFILAVLACLGAAFAYGLGANLVRVRFAGEPPLAIAIGQQLAVAVVLLPLLPAVPLRATPDAVDVACLLALALGSTGIAYLLYFRLLAELGATGGMTVIFVVPVFGVLWGALFLDEAIHLSTVIGGAVILLSVWLITRGPGAAGEQPEHAGGRVAVAEVD